MLVSVKIRLRRIGAKKVPYYRIVVADSRCSRNGRFIEEIGTYDPCKEPSAFNIKADRFKSWLNVGAKATDIINKLAKQNKIL